MNSSDSIQVRFFAGLREQLGTPGTTFSNPASGPMCVADLRRQLTARGDEWQALSDPSVLVAVNQEIADDSATIDAGDEVAFFPPVTGG